MAGRGNVAGIMIIPRGDDMGRQSLLNLTQIKM